MSHSSQVIVMYGGTFDPFHIGHEAICLTILAEPSVSELRILPCYLPALKSAASASSKDRLSMLNQWRKQQASSGRIAIDDRELRRQGTSYTVDTVRELKRLNPNSRLVFALGADAWNTLEKWKASDLLIETVSFWVFSRQDEGKPMLRERIPELNSAAQLTAANAGYCFFDSTVIPAVASSVIRNVQDYEKWPVPPVVKQYINDQALYQTSSA